MPTRITLDPTSPGFDTADAAAHALASSFGGDSGGLETAGVIYQCPDGKFRYSTSIGGRDDSFELAAQIPKGYTLAAIVHTHPGKDAQGQVFSPNDLKVAQSLKLPSYVRFLNDNSLRRYVAGQTPTQSMNINGARFGSKVARGDPVDLSALPKPDTLTPLTHPLTAAASTP
jgi:hypothetical protein